MQIIGKFEIQGRFAWNIAIAMLLLAMAVAMLFWKTNDAAEEAIYRVEHPMLLERIFGDWRNNIATTVTRTATVVSGNDPKLISIFASEAAATSEKTTRLINELEGLIKNDEDKALFAEILDSRKAYQSSRDKVYTLLAEGHPEQAGKVMEEGYLPLANRYQDLVATFLDRQRAQLDQRTREAVQRQESTVGTIIVAALLAGGLFMYVLMTLLGICRAPTAAAVGGASASVASQDVPASGETLSDHSAANGLQAGTVSHARDQWNEFYEILA